MKSVKIPVNRIIKNFLIRNYFYGPGYTIEVKPGVKKVHTAYEVEDIPDDDNFVIDVELEKPGMWIKGIPLFRDYRIHHMSEFARIQRSLIDDPLLSYAHVKTIYGYSGIDTNVVYTIDETLGRTFLDYEKGKLEVHLSDEKIQEFLEKDDAYFYNRAKEKYFSAVPDERIARIKIYCNSASAVYTSKNRMFEINENMKAPYVPFEKGIYSIIFPKDYKDWDEFDFSLEEPPASLESERVVEFPDKINLSHGRVGVTMVDDGIVLIKIVGTEKFVMAVFDFDGKFVFGFVDDAAADYETTMDAFKY